MNDNKMAATEADTAPLHSKGIREHTDGREFRPWLLLGVTLVISAVLAVICYGLQIYFIGPG